MKIFELMKEHNQEQIAFYTDKTVKLRAILSINSTALGPAIGGIRIYRYTSVDNALFDLCRLSQAMTYKTAAAGLNFGGGYMVVVEQDNMEKKEPLFRSLGRFIESFNGRYIAAEDFGVTEESMEYIGMETQFLTGLPDYYGGSGNHSQMATYGAFKGIQAAAQHKWGSDNLTGKKIIIQGYGKIGTLLAEMAKENGAHVVVADIREEVLTNAKKSGYETIGPAQIYTEPCDILCPCAIGPIITATNAPHFRCQIIAGPANNQLLCDDDDMILKKHGILYAPDFLINAGGIIDVSEEYLGYIKDRVIKKTENIYDRVLEILKYADDQNISTNQAAIHYALKRIDTITHLKGRYLAEENWNLKKKHG